MKYAVHDANGSSYDMKYREFRTLRDAAAFINGISADALQEFRDIQVVTYESLSDPEKAMLTMLTKKV